MPTFAQLKTRVQGYLIDNPTFTVNLIGDWINKAMKDAERRHNYRHMEESAEFTTTADTRLLAARPANWKAVREAPYVTHDDGATKELAWGASRDMMRRQFAEDDPDDIGDPSFLLDDPQEGLLVYPLPDGASDASGGEYSITVPYWEYSAPLVNDADTNFWTDNFEWYLVFYAVAEGALANRDTTEATIYMERAEAERVKSVRENKQQAGKPPRMLTIRRGVYGTGRQPPRR